MNAPAETPATETSAKKESALALFIASVKGQKLNASDKTKIGNDFKKFIAKKQAALDVLKALEAEENEVSRKMVHAYGKDSVSIDGRQYSPTSRDERIYYKAMSGGTVEL